MKIKLFTGALLLYGMLYCGARLSGSLVRTDNVFNLDFFGRSNIILSPDNSVQDTNAVEAFFMPFVFVEELVWNHDQF